ncbi:MAG TPA: hypothetical protein VH275_05290 [Solirubrobacterales bacterium]|nr:hypothetical protein [Solirubrobacterales bacterium]
MKRARLLATGLLLLGALAWAPSAGASPGRAWTISVSPLPANVPAGAKGEFLIEAINVGAAPTTGPSVIEAQLPAGLAFAGILSENATPPGAPLTCSFTAPTVRCESAQPVGAGNNLSVQVKFTAPPGASGSAALAATVSGGGAEAHSSSATVALQSQPLPFGFLAPGLRAPLSEEDGTPAALAGSHPYQQTVSFALPTKEVLSGAQTTNSGHPRDILLELPPGLLGDPTATPILCTEAELQAEQCPAPSQLGILQITTAFVEAGHLGFAATPLYNMVPPPGSPAELGVDIGGAGIYAHLLAGVRSDGDYGIEVSTPDVLALPTQPIFGIQAQVWGDPSASAHEHIRGGCLTHAGSCSLTAQKTAFWTLPGNCGSEPLTTSVKADSWEEPGLFHEARYQSADLAGNPVALSGCNRLQYQPTISAQPTTDLADSPSGLDFTLHQPQDTDKEHAATAELRDATVTLPAGMSVNPSQADGLGACSEAEIGYLGQGHYSKAPQSCPDAAKLGTLEVASPLLAQYEDGGTKPVLDPETLQAVPRPLYGSIYLAKPFANQFGSLLAIYLAVEDPQSGIVSKLAGRVEPDPQSGQLTTVFEENPQLPLQDIRLSLFKGARGSLITPLACGTHTTSSDLLPWSAPEGADAHPSDSFQTSAEPGGGACPSSEGAAANAPAFSAGTESPQAGSYSPFLLKLSREDGSQRLAGLDTTLAPGLTGKLAGVAECSEAQIAQAQGRSHPEEGILERQDPSCPLSSQLGTVIAAAGAGPTPYYTTGHAYLAGPYKGAPLSLVTITPAIAGPFDLGTVVIRVALHVDPETARIHAVSDPFPTILDGIPLDLRSVALKMDRPNFTLNPTSCDPLAITGAAISTLGNTASLTSPFQVGGCQALPFKPQLTLRLKGGTKRSKDPALIATLTAKPGEANIAKASVALPHSEFLDQAHIKTICTRVQFAAGGGHGEQCPPGSVYGRARAITPLLDQPLEGPVFLRSSSNPLPDLVAALNGQIDVDLDGTVDSIHGGIRNRFEVVPDAPVSKFVLEMQGGKKGLLENSRNLCRSVNRATVKFTGQNGKVYETTPVLLSSCKKHKKHGEKGHKKHHAAKDGGGK